MNISKASLSIAISLFIGIAYLLGATSVLVFPPIGIVCVGLVVLVFKFVDGLEVKK
jgi:hypothetical protein